MEVNKSQEAIVGKTGVSGFFIRAFNLSVLQKSRMPWVDYLRGIAIILVVYRHALIGIERSGIIVPDYLVRANMIFYSFRMPLFFIVSGLFINGSLLKKKASQLIQIKFENLIYPYLVWATIQITLQVVLKPYVNSDRGLQDYAYILYQPRALDQFWYLPALFNTTVLYILIKTKFRPAPWVQIGFGLLVYFLAPLLGKISMLSDWMEFYLFFALGDILSSAFFTDKVQRFLKNPVPLICMIPVFAGLQLFYLTQEEVFYHDVPAGQAEFLIIALTGCLTMFMLAFQLQRFNMMRFLRVLGFHSLFIYVMHVLVIAFIRVVFTKFLGIHEPAVLLVLCIASGVTIPVMAYNLFIKDHFAWFLFTYKKPALLKDRSAGNL